MAGECTEALQVDGAVTLERRHDRRIRNSPSTAKSTGPPSPVSGKRWANGGSSDDDLVRGSARTRMRPEGDRGWSSGPRRTADNSRGLGMPGCGSRLTIVLVGISPSFEPRACQRGPENPLLAARPPVTESNGRGPGDRAPPAPAAPRVPYGGRQISKNSSKPLKLKRLDTVPAIAVQLSSGGRQAPVARARVALDHRGRANDFGRLQQPTALARCVRARKALADVERPAPCPLRSPLLIPAWMQSAPTSAAA